MTMTTMKKITLRDCKEVLLNFEPNKKTPPMKWNFVGRRVVEQKAGENKTSL
jgi:hypothetical protein